VAGGCTSAILDDSSLLSSPLDQRSKLVLGDNRDGPKTLPQRFLPGDANDERLQFDDVAERRTTQDASVELQSANALSEAGNYVFRSARLYVHAGHQGLEASEVSLDLARHLGHRPRERSLWQTSSCTVRDRNTSARSSMMIPQIDL
jgi:hypothetical protein